MPTIINVKQLSPIHAKIGTNGVLSTKYIKGDITINDTTKGWAVKKNNKKLGNIRKTVEGIQLDVRNAVILKAVTNALPSDTKVNEYHNPQGYNIYSLLVPLKLEDTLLKALTSYEFTKGEIVSHNEYYQERQAQKTTEPKTDPKKEPVVKATIKKTTKKVATTKRAR